MRTWIERTVVALAAMLIVMLVGLVGCTKVPPNTSPEGKAAIKGRDVVNAARAAIPAIDTEMQAGRVPQSIGVPVLQGIRVVFVETSTNLADALTIIDQAKTAAESKAGADKATAALQVIQVALASATSPITDPKMKGTVTALLLNLIQAINSVRGLVGLPETSISWMGPTHPRVIQAGVGDVMLGGLNQTNAILLAFAGIMATIQAMRAKWRQDHPKAPAGEDPLSDEKLIALMKGDALTGIAEVDAVLAKYPQPPKPTE